MALKPSQILAKKKAKTNDADNDQDKDKKGGEAQKPKKNALIDFIAKHKGAPAK